MDPDDIKGIGVVGAGLIGHGIALDFALGGYDVFLSSSSQASLQRALAQIEADLQTLVSLGISDQDQARSAFARVHPTLSLQHVANRVQVVIEAVYEDLALKQEVFRTLDGLCPEQTILASGTSSLKLSDIASVTQRPHRVVLSNYSNPPFLMPVVEVLRNARTSDDTVQALVGLLAKVGKRPVVIQEELVGFLGNRLQAALLREALWLVQRGVVTAQDVDTALRYGLAARWAAAGVFEVFDAAGWDVITSAVYEIFPDLESTPEVPPLLRQKVERGELGMKSGRGFYEWNPGAAEAFRERVARFLVEIQKLQQGT